MSKNKNYIYCVSKKEKNGILSSHLLLFICNSGIMFLNYHFHLEQFSLKSLASEIHLKLELITVSPPQGSHGQAEGQVPPP